MHSVGRMFGLTFWENWYVIGENEADDGLPPFKFVYYTGHTLQGNYEGEGVRKLAPTAAPCACLHGLFGSRDAVSSSFWRP